MYCSSIYCLDIYRWKVLCMVRNLDHGLWRMRHLASKRVTFKISMKYLEIISANCVAPSIKILWVLAHLNNLLRFQVTIERIISHKNGLWCGIRPKLPLKMEQKKNSSLFQPKFNARNFFGSSQFNKKAKSSGRTEIQLFQFWRGSSDSEHFSHKKRSQPKRKLRSN